MQISLHVLEALHGSDICRSLKRAAELFTLFCVVQYLTLCHAISFCANTLNAFPGWADRRATLRAEEKSRNFNDGN